MESTVTYCLCEQPYKKDEFMIQCDNCKDWFHGNCVGLKEYNAIELDKYHCPRCESMTGPTILKSYKNWHRHDFWDPDAYGKPVQTGTAVFLRELCARHFPSEGEVVFHMRGQQLTEHYLTQNGFNNPVVIDGKDGLDMTVPPDNFSLYDVEQYVGSEKEIDVIDVMRQSVFKMNLRDFVEYFNSPQRTRIFNCVSLEFSGTKLSRLVEAPLVARKLDWVNTVWPKDAPDDVHQKPMVQKYCLMSVKDSYTDFHIDFGGTSVWYHVLKGEKIFYFIRPTPANLTLYQQWMASSTQNVTFFGDQADQCYKCVLHKGQTMLIPTGWIHAVLTTSDSLVFGGNFLHSLNIPMQLQVYDIEKKIKTEEKFKFPSFETINWYAAKKIMHQLKELNQEDQKCPSFLLTGSKSLLSVLKQWNTDKDYNTNNRKQIPDVINSHKLLKDLGKEMRQAERYLNSLNPPKPERESKRKRKRPVNKDFVDFSQPQRIYNLIADRPVRSKVDPPQNHKLVPPHIKELNKTLEAANTDMNLSLAGTSPLFYPYEQPINHPSSSKISKGWNQSQPNLQNSYDITDKAWTDFPVDPNERWVVTDVSNQAKSGAVLKFTLGSKDTPNELLSASYDCTPGENGINTIFDFSEDIDNKDDEFALKIDESPKKRRQNVSKNKLKNCEVLKNRQSVMFSGIEPVTPKNGIESLLKASALTNKFIDSGRASPSTREAIAGMLSIGETCSINPLSTSGTKSRRKRSTPPKDNFEENIKNVHQDEEYIYPSLDNSDDEDFHIFKPRGRSKVDEAWNPKARVGPLLPKMNRPAREGTKKQAVEKVLEAAAAKRASEPIIETSQKRAYRKKKIRTKITIMPTNDASLVTVTKSSQTISSTTVARQKKGMKTAKQRLGKILKIHKMIH